MTANAEARLAEARDNLKTLALDDTLISVDGRAEQSDGKSEAGADRAAEMLGQMIRQAIGGDDQAPTVPEGGGAADEAC